MERMRSPGRKGRNRKDALSPHKKLDSLGDLQTVYVRWQRLQQIVGSKGSFIQARDRLWSDSRTTAETRDKESQLQRDPRAFFLALAWGFRS